MKRHARIAFAVLILTVGLAGCAGSNESGPQATVQDFYRHLNAGDYANAMALYSSEALELWEDPNIAETSAFSDWAKVETKSGAVDRVEIVDESLEEQKANVTFEVVYSDGSKTSHTVELVQEDGQWKMGLVG